MVRRARGFERVRLARAAALDMSTVQPRRRDARAHLVFFSNASRPPLYFYFETHTPAAVAPPPPP